MAKRSSPTRGNTPIKKQSDHLLNTASTKARSHDGNTHKSDDLDSQITNLKVAITGLKRGAKPGQNVSKRKAVEDLSEAPSAKKSRDRKAKMSTEQAEIERAKKADYQAWNRLRIKFVKSAEYAALSASQQSDFLEQKRQELMQQRTEEGGYSQILVKDHYASILEDLQREKVRRDTAFVNKMRFEEGVTDLQDDVYWEDSDEESEELPIDVIDEFTVLVGDSNNADDLAAQTVLQEVAVLFGQLRVSAPDIYKYLTLKPEPKHTETEMFLLMKRHVKDTQKVLKRRLKLLSMHGVVYHEVEKGIGSGIFKCLGVSKYAQALKMLGKHKPHSFFGKKVRGLLRCMWSSSKKDWIDLPGPAEWWPDNPVYYARHGFEVWSYRRHQYLRARASLKLLRPTEDWARSCLHDNAPYDIIWDQYFGDE